MNNLAVRLELLASLCIGLGLRAIVSLHSYSGAKTPPMYGDYEAQRHWQEITINVPIQKWYMNSTENDLLYWGLDYPPLTAYHSYLMGIAAKSINNSFVELYTSRGIESQEHKSFMRFTVLTCDVLIYISACYFLAVTLKREFKLPSALPIVLISMLYPGQILIDNGHFQYNNVSLAFAALAIATVLRGRHCIAAFLFTLALNYKQMELYHSLPFFFYLLKQCRSEKCFADKLKKFFEIAFTVLLTQIALVIPWLDSLETISSVVDRMFPFKRGVFEDKVANIWCSLNIIYKFKQKLSIQMMGLICLITTAVLALPINVHMFSKQGKHTFLYCLTNTSLVFFLCSYQVHEKSILLAAFPAFCLFINSPYELAWFLEVTVFSMLPLFIKDKLVIAYLSLTVIFNICMSLVNGRIWNIKSKLYYYCYWMSQSVMVLLAIGAVINIKPAKYPDLWSLLISFYSCVHFVAFLLFGVYQQITTNKCVI